MKFFLHKLKYSLFYWFGRKYKYCFNCLFDRYTFTKVEWRYMLCWKCYEKHSSGRQG